MRWNSSVLAVATLFGIGASVACTSDSDQHGSIASDGAVQPVDGSTSTGGAAGVGAASSSGGASGGTAGSIGSGGTVDSGGIAASGGATNDASACVRATRLWFEDWETGDYSRWTSQTYGADWGDACQDTGLSTDHAVSGTLSNRSEITCVYTADTVHRGYGGLQFDGDTVMAAYTNAGVGIDAPFGLVNTYHSWLETSAVFENGKWFSFWTVHGDCDWAAAGDDVLTLGLEDPSNRLAAAHYQANAGGTREFLPDAPSFPLGRWVRTTIYVNYYTGEMFVWQDGQAVSRVTFDRPGTTICQFHWGAYASADNDDLVLYEDDNSIWKLEEPWTEFDSEPWLGEATAVCAN